MKYSVMSDRDFESLLKNNGYVVIRNHGDHSVWFNAQKNERSVIIKKIIILRRIYNALLKNRFNRSYR